MSLASRGYEKRNIKARIVISIGPVIKIITVPIMKDTSAASTYLSLPERTANATAEIASGNGRY
jgi:hypothetical protein